MRNLFRLIVLIFAVTTTNGCCSGGDMDIDEVEIGHALINILGAELPSSAINIHGQERIVFTAVYYFRFDCTEDDLSELLESTDKLPDQLLRDREAIKIQTGADWWNPGGLEEPYGATTSWSDETNNYDCAVQRGDATKEDYFTVFILCVIESHSNSGGRAFEGDRVRVNVR